MPRTSQDLYRRKLVDAWVTDLGNIYAPQGYQTLPVGRHFAFQGHTTHVILVSVIRSTFRDATDRRSFEARMIFRHCNAHPGGFNVDPACVDFIKKKKVSVRLKRCEFCLVTLHAQHLVAFKPLTKREYPRNVWFTFKILVCRSELS